MFKEINRIMQEELITFETAKLAKEKGFSLLTVNAFAPEPTWRNSSSYKKIDCYNFHEYGDIEPFDWNNKTTRHYDHFFSRPTQSLLQKWLREVHNIHINITRIYNFSKKPAIFQGYNIYISGKSSEDITYGEINNKLIRKYYNNYEEALEMGLQESLKLIKI